MRRYILHNLSCPSCANKLESALNAMPSVQSASINFNTGVLSINTDDIDSIKAKIKQIEPQVEIKTEGEETSDAQKRDNKNLSLTFLIALFALGMLIGHIQTIRANIDGFIGIDNFANFLSMGILIVTYACAGFSVFKNAYNNIKNKIFLDENCLMTIATLAAVALGEISEACAVMVFFKIGEFIESRAIKKSRDLLKSGADIIPIISHKKIIDCETKIEKYIDIHPQELKIGDIALVKVGERAPSDGIIISGDTYADMASINGESAPISLTKGDKLLAGAINIGSAIEMRILSEFKNSQIAKIKEIIDSAEDKKPPTERLITRFSKIYMGIILVIAACAGFIVPIFTGDFSEWIYRALVALMVSCPCALMISIPLGYFGALGVASRHGIIIKGSIFLEKLADLKSICFDKTGTLTNGEFKINSVKTMPGFSERELIKLALSAQRNSKHPIAAAMLRLQDNNAQIYQILNHEERHGMGVIALCQDDSESFRILVGNKELMSEFNIKTDQIEGENLIYVAKDKDLIGGMDISDNIKEDAPSFIQELRKLGVNPLAILSGDSAKNVEHVAKRLDIKNFFAGLLPTKKADILKSLRNQDEKIAFVGDGINDSIILAHADIGISIHAKNSSSDINKESADIILTNNKLHQIIRAIKIARKTRVITWQNISMVLLIKAAILILGIMGIAHMWLAVFGDVGVALIALANALRVAKI